MLEHWEYLRSAVQNNYAFKEISIIQEEPLLIQTERGLKRVRVWTNDQLLMKHLRWRTKLISDHFFLDRMYATIYGATSIRFDRYLITIHDAPLDPAPIAGREQQWAELVMLLLQKSRGHCPMPAASQIGAQAAFVSNQLAESGMAGDLVNLARACAPSAQNRAEQADRLRNRHRSSGKTFILPEDFSFAETRLLLDTLFIALGQSGPISGYPALAQFLLQAALENGAQAVESILAAFAQQMPMTREMLDRIAAEWYAPGEWFQLAEWARMTPDQLERRERFKQVWDMKTRLIGRLQTFQETSETVGEGG
ncbi:MAG: hypothetical protein ABF683_08000 [Sporolactobacillus sp.]